MMNALHSPVAKSRRTISCSNIRRTRDTGAVCSTMTIFDIPAINATLNGLSTPPPIWGGRPDLDSARSQAVALIFLTVIPALRSRLIAVEKWANSFSDLALCYRDRRLFHVVPMLSIDSL
jgi:hypothetical protein